jgi:hypothetical protein
VVLERYKFTIHEHGLDVEASRSIDGLDVFGRLHKRFDFAIGNVLGGDEYNVIADGCKEGGLLYEEKVSQENRVIVPTQNLGSYRPIIG